MYRTGQTLLIVAMMLPHLVIGQAPEWWWVSSIQGNGSYVQTEASRAHDGGYFVSLSSSQLELPWGMVQGTGGVLVHMNPEGEPTAAVPMPTAKQLDMMDDGTVRFLLTYEVECSVGGNIFTAPPGISAVVGYMDTEGTLTGLVNIPALLTISPYDPIDIHKGPSGDIYAIGIFEDSVTVSDTVLYQSGTFFAHFTETGALVQARRIDVVYNSFEGGKVVEGLDGSVYVILQHVLAFDEFGSDPPAEFGVGLFSFNANWQIQWFILDDGEGLNPTGSAQLTGSPLGGVYLAYPARGGMTQGGPVRVIHYASEGDTLWYNGSFRPGGESSGGMSLDRIESRLSGELLISGAYEGEPLDYGPYPIPSRYVPGMFVGALNGEGEWTWMIANTVGRIHNCVASMSPSGDVYTSGAYPSLVEFGPFAFPYSSNPPAFIGRIGFGPLSLRDEAQNTPLDLTLFPNPSSGSVTVSLERSSSGLVEVLDLFGRTVRQRERVSFPVTLSLKGLSPGTYVVRYADQSSRLIIE